MVSQSWVQYECGCKSLEIKLNTIQFEEIQKKKLHIMRFLCKKILFHNKKGIIIRKKSKSKCIYQCLHCHEIFSIENIMNGLKFDVKLNMNRKRRNQIEYFSNNKRFENDFEILNCEKSSHMEDSQLLFDRDDDFEFMFSKENNYYHINHLENYFNNVEF